MIMDKRIKHIRKGIKKRKTSRRPVKDTNDIPILPAIEEPYTGHVEVVPAKMFHFKKIYIRLIGATAIFVLSMFLLQTNITSLQKVSSITNKAIHDEFPFAKMNEWYVTNFGEPLSIIPVKKKTDDLVDVNILNDSEVVETFSENGNGLVLHMNENNDVRALERGVVIFAGNHKKYGKSVIIQHADDSITTFGQLSNIDVHLYEAVEKDALIAKGEKDKEIYVQVEKNNTFVDPLQVLEVDDVK